MKTVKMGLEVGTVVRGIDTTIGAEGGQNQLCLLCPLFCEF